MRRYIVLHFHYSSQEDVAFVGGGCQMELIVEYVNRSDDIPYLSVPSTIRPLTVLGKRQNLVTLRVLSDFYFIF